MKARVYLRVAPTARGFRYAATGKPSSLPLMNGNDVLPTIAFAIDLNLPADAFRIPLICSLDLSLEQLQPITRTEVEVAP